MISQLSGRIARLRISASDQAGQRCRVTTTSERRARSSATMPVEMSGRYFAITLALKNVSRSGPTLSRTPASRRRHSVPLDLADEGAGALVARVGEDLLPAAPARRSAPSSMNTTRSAASRAKPISWLTTIMVMPLSRRSRMTASTEPTSSGSSALVGSSNSMTRGSSAIARAMATRCCWPPDSSAGRWSARSASPTRSSAARPSASASARVLPATLRSASVDVAERRHVRIEVERLEHHADALAGMVDVGPRRRACRCRRPRSLPDDGSSSRLRQRSRVDLPEPDGPITNTSSRSATSRSTPFRT